MRRPNTRLLASFLPALIVFLPIVSLTQRTGPAWGADPGPGPDRTDKSSRPGTSDPTTGDVPTFSVSGDVFRELSDEAEHHFKQAREAMTRGEPARAAADIRKAASYLRLEASRGHEADAGRLRAEASTIQALANRTTTIPDSELVSAFAHADLVLAHHHFDRLERDWRDHDIDDTAADIVATRHHLLAARGWHGGDVPASIVAGYDQAGALAARMGQPIGWSAAEVDSVKVFLAGELGRQQGGS
ncbi:MAG TPA: hypothetical protein VF720_16970 [Candidatus Eisenbacteria bacterium]